MKILGVDPGSARIGYGLVEKNGSKLKLLAHGTLEIKVKPDALRLLELDMRFNKLVKKLSPDLVAVEKLYFIKNQKTALNVAQSRGIILLAVIKLKIPLKEYTPLEIKQSMTGYGLADKKSVANMVTKILGISEIKGYDDVTDAIAAALTAENRLRIDNL